MTSARLLENVFVDRALGAEALVALARAVAVVLVGGIGIVEEAGEVEEFRLRVGRVVDLLEQLSAADDIVEIRAPSFAR